MRKRKKKARAEKKARRAKVLDFGVHVEPDNVGTGDIRRVFLDAAQNRRKMASVAIVWVEHSDARSWEMAGSVFDLVGALDHVKYKLNKMLNEAEE